MSFEMAMVNNPVLNILWRIQTNIFTCHCTTRKHLASTTQLKGIVLGPIDFHLWAKIDVQTLQNILFCVNYRFNSMIYVSKQQVQSKERMETTFCFYLSSFT